jgi:hypothetical protein
MSAHLEMMEVYRDPAVILWLRLTLGIRSSALPCTRSDVERHTPSDGSPRAGRVQRRGSRSNWRLGAAVMRRVQAREGSGSEAQQKRGPQQPPPERGRRTQRGEGQRGSCEWLDGGSVSKQAMLWREGAVGLE